MKGGGPYHVEGREAAEAVGPQGRQQLPRWGGAPIAPAARPSKVAWVGRGGGGEGFVGWQIKLERARAGGDGTAAAAARRRLLLL